MTPMAAAAGGGGGAAIPRAARAPGPWAGVYDELRSHQCLSSVINDPSKGRGLLRNFEGISDLWSAVGDIMEELGEAREAEAQGGPDGVFARTDALIGPVPELPDFQPYLETFADLWEVYHRNHRSKVRRQNPQGPSAGRDAVGEDAAACDAHRAVPHEFFRSDFKLEQHQIFRQSLQTSVERQEELNSELTHQLDLIEVSLFEQIRRAQRDQLFDSLARLNEPLQEDLKSTLSVLAKLRGRMRSVQRRQLRNGLAVGRLARRKQRVAEVLQRLDCLAHVQQSQPSIQMLLQGQDYVTALDLLESTTSALESNLKGLASTKPSANRLAGLTGTFDRSVEADFVHHATEAILAPATSSTARAASPDNGVRAAPEGASEVVSELRGAERLRRLCWCLIRRSLLRATLSASLRDVLLGQMKKVLKARARSLLEEQVAKQGGGTRGKAGDVGAFMVPLEPEDLPDAGSAMPAAPEASSSAAAGGPGIADEDAAPGSTAPAEGGATPSAEPRAPSPPHRGRSPSPVATRSGPGPSPAAAKGAAEAAAAGITQALSTLNLEGFQAFWLQLLQDCEDVAARFCEFALLVQDTATSPPQHDEQVPSAPQAGLEGELLRLLEVIMNSYLQKVGVLLQARQAEHRTVTTADWKKLLKLSYASLDRVRDYQERCRHRLNLKEPYAGTDVRAGVRAILYTQTKCIIEEFDKRSIEKMECALDQERWERTDVPSQYKVILEQLLGREQPIVAEGTDQGVERFLHVEGVHFLVVPAALTLVQLLNEYVQLCREFDSLPEVVVQRMCGLLKLFNGRTHQLMLGGQAVQKQTLKKITASNLALCSQTCGLVAQILPILQQRLQTLFPTDQSGASPSSSSVSTAARSAVSLLVGDLSKTATEFTDHRTALFGKLSDLLTERYQFHAKRWLGTPHHEVKEGSDAVLWKEDTTGADAAAVSAALNPHEALDGFVKDITNMYRVLLKNLTGDSVRRIFAKAFEEIAVKFDQRLCQEISAPGPPYEDKLGRTLGDRMALDIAFLQEQLEKLSGISTPLQRLLVDLVSHMRTRLPNDDPLKALHPPALEALQRLGRLPR